MTDPCCNAYTIRGSQHVKCGKKAVVGYWYYILNHLALRCYEHEHDVPPRASSLLRGKELLTAYAEHALRQIGKET